ncbi:hypothetical protein GCM10011376_02310 [Nocardioides flavus (ex Wang et al. 2016)]|uniref:Uncharacterized protein n=1 Tax=Nocardioides flavus (ex Wang et al. 2016) TaxID=2058780 RepID=A0ABQ3HEE2_9ACTN|nr:hypothetical protein [Nocardioides flavus (ex Wang et al. 2016)]GHE15205.1 hypothetical protein GCM10011376_02310 [Nocardioides flavus (ex Wang et al. 2016)]
MTRVAIDHVEAREDGLRFGDPIGCRYHWVEPGEVDAYGDSVRRLAARVELAVDAFERTSTLSEEVFAGEAADTLRERAARRHEESATVCDDLRGLGRAINDWSDVLRRHRDGLEQLHAFATSTDLDVRDHRIWPPVETLPRDATARQADAWQADWRAYRACFEARVELRDARRDGSRALLAALADHAGVQPDEDRQKHVAATADQVRFGDLRREAAEEAMEAVEAGAAAEAARSTVAALERREQGALDSLEELVLAEAPHEEIAAQSAKVQALLRELTEARVEAREAESVADREQAQADRAARSLEAGAIRSRLG